MVLPEDAGRGCLGSRLRPGSPGWAWGRRWWSRQAGLQLDQAAGGVVHLLHGQAEPVPGHPQPLVAGPAAGLLHTPQLEVLGWAWGGGRGGLTAGAGLAWCRVVR
jgi:hypothetical protein